MITDDAEDKDGYVDVSKADLEDLDAKADGKETKENRNPYEPTAASQEQAQIAVSYTHLTLPTKRIV